MNNIDQLKKIALRLRIDPIGTVAHATRVKTITKILSDLNKSYQRFIEIEFFKNEAFKEINEAKSSAFVSLKNDMELLIVDIQFDKFEISVAPAIAEVATLFKDEVEAWKRESFFRYKTLLSSDFRNLKYMELIEKWYDKQERSQIYKPVFDLIHQDYKLHIVNNEGKALNSIVRPDKNKMKFYIAPKEQVPVKQEERTYLAYLKLKKKGDQIDFKKSSIKEVFYFEEMQYDVYPYKPDFIQLDGASIFLNKILQCDVKYNKGRYIISSEDLNVVVSADTREAAEQDFENSFYKLYLDFTKAKPKDLSPADKVRRKKLLAMVKSVSTDN